MGKERLVSSDKLVITNPILDINKIRNLSRMSIGEILRLGKIDVAECLKTGNHYVLDGNHRVKVLKNKGLKNIPVDVDCCYEDDVSESYLKIINY